MCVNGTLVTLTAAPETPILYLLRNDLGLRGTRFGCGQGLCGACTVLVDGRPTHSCETPLWAVAGAEIRTIEALGSEARPHPVQQALLDEQAGQCGYCLSGIVMEITGLIDRPEPADRTEIVAALERHLCRCGAQPRILRAVDRLCGDRTHR